MYTGRSLTDLAKELERQAMVKQDYMAPTNLMEMSVRKVENPAEANRLQFRVADKFTGNLTEVMHDQLGGYTKIPSPYYDRMRNGDANDQALLAANVNHWLHTNRETRLVRTLDGRARSFHSKRYRTIDNWDVANASLPILVEESNKLGSLEILSTDITEKRLYIKVASKRLTYEVKKGDVVQAGIVISNSEVGLGAVRIEPFLYRLICLNGATIEDNAVRKFHLGRQSAELEAAEQVFRDETRRADDKAFMLKLQDVVRAAFNDDNFAQLKGVTIDATTRKITAPVQDVVEEVANRFHMTDKVRDSFLNNLIMGGDVTQWGLANAVTAVANNAENYEQATELERIGGAIMVMDGNRWKELAAA